MSDPAITALQLLVDTTDGGRAAVADAIHANEQTLYQILSGVPLKSGKARTVGRDLRERLDRAFPGWMDFSMLETEARQAFVARGIKVQRIDHRRTPVVLPDFLVNALGPGKSHYPDFRLELPNDAIAWCEVKGQTLASMAPYGQIAEKHPKDYLLLTQHGPRMGEAIDEWLQAQHGIRATVAPPAAASVARAPIPLEQALLAVADAVGGMTAGRWTMVRARLDDLAGHPEMRDEVVADVLLLMQAPATKQRSAA